MIASPRPAPVVVGPAQTKFEIYIFVGGKILDRRFEQSLAAEPVKIKTERGKAGLFCQRHLPLLNLRDSQIVETELRGKPRLIVADELRNRLGDVGPLGEAVSPPFVVFVNGMKLRKIFCDELDAGRRRIDSRKRADIFA